MFQLLLYNYTIFTPISLFLFYPICHIERCHIERGNFFKYLIIYFSVRGNTVLGTNYWASSYLF